MARVADKASARAKQPRCSTGARASVDGRNLKYESLSSSGVDELVLNVNTVRWRLGLDSLFLWSVSANFVQEDSSGIWLGNRATDESRR